MAADCQWITDGSKPVRWAGFVPPELGPRNVARTASGNAGVADATAAVVLRRFRSTSRGAAALWVPKLDHAVDLFVRALARAVASANSTSDRQVDGAGPDPLAGRG